MKKSTTIIFIIVIALLGAGYIFISKNSSQLTLPQTTKPKETAKSQEISNQNTSEKIPLDSNDNLDEALQNLNQIK